MIYTGIGARKTPCPILNAMVQVGEYMYNAGHTLRSGGAQGADRAFEIGADYSFGRKRNSRNLCKLKDPPELKEIYLPIKDWQGNISPLYTVSHEAMIIASKYHPRWDPLPTFVKLLMGRNSYQLLGLNLKTPTDFIVCWTPGGKVVGGTGQALRMAAAYGIPIFNLGSAPLEEMNERIQHFLGVDK